MILNPVSVSIGLAAGAVMGALYFGGLFWSVMRLKTVEHKKRFLFYSWLLRSVGLIGGLFVLMRYDEQVLFAGVAGLFAARFVIVRQVKKQLRAKEKPAC